MPMKKWLLAMLLLLTSLGSGCATQNFDKDLGAITGPYRFSIMKWELGVLGNGLKNIFSDKPATANDNWMTTEFVPFSSSLEFTPPKETDIGFLILKKDNPSGLPENDDQIEIPIRFR